MPGKIGQKPGRDPGELYAGKSTPLVGPTSTVKPASSKPSKVSTRKTPTRRR